VLSTSTQVTSLIDGYYVNLTLTESQRLRAIEYSGTTGGDGSALTFQCLNGMYSMHYYYYCCCCYY
jgi:hypothetical protein